ncbi:MAG: ion channel [Bdellovibrionota bacterium]
MMGTPMSLFSKMLKRLKRVTGIARRRMITAVILVLLSAWLVVSWFVYQAEYSAQGANITTFGKSLWWGIVTFLTVGYGDHYPITLTGRIWAGLLMFIGVFGIAVITSRISTYFLEEVLREGRGVVDTEKLKGHFIVCGWKEEMHELLTHILDFNPGLTASDLVIVANLNKTVMDALRSHPRLKGLHVIVGNPAETVTLERAVPKRARKILILADRTPNQSGNVPSVTEVDARTIMIAMALSNIARGTLVAAELLDAKLDQYLKLASVSEIIYSREYSRLMLGNASGGTGVSNIIFDLLDPKTSTRITTKAIPEALVGLTYADIKSALEKNDQNTIVVGVLENTGSVQSIKELALKQAQKTPDVGRLVENLKAVKELRCNRPVFNPGSSYTIHENSMAIVLETKFTVEGMKNVGKEKPSPIQAA